MVKYPSMVTSTSQRWLQLPIMLCWTWDPSGRFPPAAECDTFQYSNRTHLAWNPIVTPPSDRRCHRWCHSPLKLQFWGIPNFSTKPHHVWGESGLPSLSFGAKMGQGLGPRLQPLQNILDYMMWGYKTYPPGNQTWQWNIPTLYGKIICNGVFLSCATFEYRGIYGGFIQIINALVIFAKPMAKRGRHLLVLRWSALSRFSMDNDHWKDSIWCRCQEASEIYADLLRDSVIPC